MKSVDLTITKKFSADINGTTLDEIIEGNTRVQIDGLFTQQEMTTLLFLIGSWGPFKKIIKKKKYDRKR